MSQKSDILKCLKKRGFIDDTMARKFYGIRRLAARIMELREHHTIYTEMVEFENRHGHKGRFARYHLERPALQR